MCPRRSDYLLRPAGLHPTCCLNRCPLARRGPVRNSTRTAGSTRTETGFPGPLAAGPLASPENPDSVTDLGCPGSAPACFPSAGSSDSVTEPGCSGWTGSAVVAESADSEASAAGSAVGSEDSAADSGDSAAASAADSAVDSAAGSEDSAAGSAVGSEGFCAGF